MVAGPTSAATSKTPDPTLFASDLHPWISLAVKLALWWLSGSVGVGVIVIGLIWMIYSPLLGVLIVSSGILIWALSFTTALLTMSQFLKTLGLR